jgi:type IV pilus assembly protein PilW
MTQRERGLSLVELMVALTIGSVLVIGAVTVYANSRATYAVNDALARLQEQARYVLTVVEPEIELAGFYAFTNSPETLRLISGGDASAVVATATAMRQRPLPPAAAIPVQVPGLPAAARACGVNFAVDVLTPIQGSDGEFALGPDAQAACDPQGGGALDGTDTLTIRRASTTPTAAEADRLQVYASRLSSRTSQHLFADGLSPGAVDADRQIHDLIVRTYYVARDAEGRPGLPTLRAKSLGAGGTFVDTEIMPGVEDLQVQFGIDTGDYDNDGAVDPGLDVNGDGIPETDGRATRYVNADFAGLDRLQVVAVRLWIRVRSDRVEPGFVDGRTYRYGDVEFTPAGEERQFRRLLLSRTIVLRNTRTL